MYKPNTPKANKQSIDEGLTHLHEIRPLQMRESQYDFFFNGNVNGGKRFVTNYNDFTLIILK
jgi:hypothetical protein